MLFIGYICEAHKTNPRKRSEHQESPFHKVCIPTQPSPVITTTLLRHHRSENDVPGTNLNKTNNRAPLHKQTDMSSNIPSASHLQTRRVTYSTPLSHTRYSEIQGNNNDLEFPRAYYSPKALYEHVPVSSPDLPDAHNFAVKRGWNDSRTQCTHNVPDQRNSYHLQQPYPMLSETTVDALRNVYNPVYNRQPSFHQTKHFYCTNALPCKINTIQGSLCTFSIILIYCSFSVLYRVEI